jgi:beta-lactamase superfamily II metal-dependent hydrolase
MIRNLVVILGAAILLPTQNLRIYAINVEGGKSTLYVSPSGESMLIDTGYSGNNNRDANRILAADIRGE